jgi:sugar phosphate isomerase/epimerase
MNGHMTRRDFLASLAGGATMLAAVAPKKRPFEFNYMLASSLYGNLPLAEILPEVRRTGATSIDLWPKPHGTQREEIDSLGLERTAELLAAHGVTLGATTRFDLGPFRLEKEIETVRQLGGRLIVVGGTGNYRLAGDALKQEVRTFAERLRPIALKAAAADVRIAIENHGDNLFATPDSLRWFAEAAPANVGIAFAPYHLPQDPTLLGELILDLGPRLALFYAWAHGHGAVGGLTKSEEREQLPGRGVFDFRPLVRALAAIDFSGPTEIFMHPTPRGIPIHPTAAGVTEELNRARAHLERLQVGLD